MPEPGEFNNVIAKLGELTGIVQEGFRAVHQRQDYANGKLSKHEERLNRIDTAEALNTDDLKDLKNKGITSDGEKSKWVDRILMLVFMGMLQLGLILLLKTGILDLSSDPSTPAVQIEQNNK